MDTLRGRCQLKYKIMLSNADNSLFYILNSLIDWLIDDRRPPQINEIYEYHDPLPTIQINVIHLLTSISLDSRREPNAVGDSFTDLANDDWRMV